MKVTEPQPGHLSIKCDCGKPITVANKHGMFCEDLCGEAESIRVGKVLNKMFNSIFKGIIE